MVHTNEKMFLLRYLLLLFHQCGAGIPGSSALESFENHCDRFDSVVVFHSTMPFFGDRYLFRRVKVWKAATPLNSCIEMELFIHPSIHPSMSTYLKFCNGGSKQRYSSCPSPQHHFQFGLGNPETFPGQVRSVHWILGLAWCHLSVECAWKKFPGDPLTGYPNDLNHIFKAEQRCPAEETCPLVFPTLIFRSLPWYHDQGWGLEHRLLNKKLLSSPQQPSTTPTSLLMFNESISSSTSWWIENEP